MRKTKSVSQIIAAHTLTYFNFLNIVLFALVMISGQYKNILFMGVVISNSLIGIIQELRVKKLIDRLTVLTATKAKVVRRGQDGSEEIVEIPIEELQVGMIIKVASGDQIVCDGTVLTSDGMEVDESMLTGESVPVHKNKGDELFSGSHIVAGAGTYEVVHVGEDNYAAKLVQKASTKKRASSEMQYAINRIIHYVSYALIPIGGTLFAIQFFRVKAGLSDALVNTVAGVLGMIPEGLVLLTSISFILGVGRLAGKRALVQEMEAIEGLARVNTLCLDKTGTITTGALKVEKVVRIREVYADTGEDVDGYGSGDLVGERANDPNALKPSSDPVIRLLEGISHAFDDTNVTGDALKSYFRDTKPFDIEATLPFNSRRKYMGTTFSVRMGDDEASQEAGSLGGSYVLGAPDFITKEEQILHKSEEYATQGFRVLLLARVDSLAEMPDELTGTKPLGLVVLSDCVKEDAPDTLRFFREMGVGIRILSGDNPATVSAVGKMAGLEGAERYVDATTLPDDPDELRKEASKYVVFGRVSPERKYELIRAFQTGGEIEQKTEDSDKDGLIARLKKRSAERKQKTIVGMVGDGVNDVLALKEADCSIAMANGADAARQTAHIVLTDSNFASMINVVKEGRTIIANIERVSALYLTKTIYSVLLCVIFIIIGQNYPFIPIQLSLIGATAIGIPSFLLALEQHEEPVISGFLGHVLKISLPGAIAMVVVTGAVQILDKILGLGPDVVSTMNMYLGGAVSLGVLVFVCRPITKLRFALCAAMVSIFAGACLIAPQFFSILPLL